jgi:hypothetical protein
MSAPTNGLTPPPAPVPAAPAPAAQPPPQAQPQAAAPQPPRMALTANGLTNEQAQTIEALRQTGRLTPTKRVELEDSYRQQNATAQEKALADYRANEQLRLSQITSQREQAKFDFEMVKNARPYPGDTTEAADMNTLIAGSQPGGDPSSVGYANAYTRQKYKEASNGNVIARDMSMFAQPTARPDQAPTVTPGPQATFERENKLRDEFQKLTADFRVVQNSYENLTKTAEKPSGAGDMSLLYSYVRLLDPTSVVRESEFAAAAASGSFGERVQGAVNRILSGERMPDSLRQDFVREARNLYDTQLRNHNQIADTYTTLAKESGADPAKVVTRFDRPQGRPPLSSFAR